MPIHGTYTLLVPVVSLLCLFCVFSPVRLFAVGKATPGDAPAKPLSLQAMMDADGSARASLPPDMQDLLKASLITCASELETNAMPAVRVSPSPLVRLRPARCSAGARRNRERRTTLHGPRVSGLTQCGVSEIIPPGENAQGMRDRLPNTSADALCQG